MSENRLVGAMLAAIAVLTPFPPLPAQTSIAERIAAAKLAESRGDAAAAEKELRAALAAATGDDHARADAELQALLARQGRAAAPQAVAAGDPVQRLIATLEQGSEKLPEVKAAIEQLDALGALAVPPLLAALPRLGPFGLANALRVLKPRADERIAAALLQRVDGGDPATVEAIARRLWEMRSVVALPVASELVRRDVPGSVVSAAFQAMTRHGADPERLRELALRLAKDPQLQGWLARTLAEAKGAWRIEPLQALMASEDGDTRMHATLGWLQAQPDLGEDEVLRHLGALPEPQRGLAASVLADQHPAWVRVAVLGLPGVEPHELHSGWTARTEWWRAPQVAAPALLAKARSASHSTSASVIAQWFEKMGSTGWTAPAELDVELVELAARSQLANRFNLVVAALPRDAEDRALALQQRLGDGEHRGFANVVAAARRPWHRVIARALASVDRADGVPRDWIVRDWSGAPAEALDALAGLTRRFNRNDDGAFASWQQPLIDAYRRGAGITVDVILPLLAAGNADAFAAVAAHDPEHALAHARATPAMTLLTNPQLDRLLRQHGTAADVPLAVRLLAAIDANVPQSAGVRDFLARFGAGIPEVIALGRRQAERGSGQQIRTDIAKTAAQGARVGDLPALLALLPELDDEVVQALSGALSPQLRAEHGPPIAAALDGLLQKPSPERPSLFVLLHWLGATGDAQALPVVRRVLAHPSAAALGAEHFAAATTLAVAGPQRAAVVAELLAAPRGRVVAAALLAPELRTDATLRAAAKDAILRLGPDLGFRAADAMFEAIAVPERIAFARELLTHERFAAVQSDVANAAVLAFGTAKPADAIAVLTRAAAHHSADVRRVVAAELGTMFTRDAAPPLIELLKDRDAEVRKQAQQALDELARYLDAKAEWDKRLK